MSPSPEKTTAGRLNLSPSPAKHSENASRAAEDRKSQSPPKKFSSPSRLGNSPSKSGAAKSGKPFGQPIEIIKSKLPRSKSFHRSARWYFTREFTLLIYNLTMFVSIDKLYWIADEAPPQNIHNAFFFNIDNVSQIRLLTSIITS